MKSTKKYAVWEFFLDDGKVSQEIRVSTAGKIELSTTFSDGTTLTGTHATQFRTDVAAKLKELHELTWKKVIVVAVKGKEVSPFRGDTTVRGSLDVIWAVRYVAQGPHTALWRVNMDDKRSEPYHHIGTGGFSDDKIRILPWSQHTEDFLTAMVASMDAIGERIEAFFTAEDLEHQIQSASTQKLLAQG